MKFVPSRLQFQKWSLPSKASYIAIPLALLLFLISLLISSRPEKTYEAHSTEQRSSGSQSPNVSGVSGNVVIHSNVAPEKQPSQADH